MALTIKDLTVERLKIRKDNPVRANVILMLANGVKQITVDERRAETEADFGKVAVKMYNETKNNIVEYEKNGADASELKAELKEIETFLPKMLSEEDMLKEAKKIIDALPEDQKVLKFIMPKLKDVEGFNMKEAKNIIEKILG